MIREPQPTIAARYSVPTPQKARVRHPCTPTVHPAFLSLLDSPVRSGEELWLPLSGRNVRVTSSTHLLRVFHLLSLYNSKPNLCYRQGCPFQGRQSRAQCGSTSVSAIHLSRKPNSRLAWKQAFVQPLPLAVVLTSAAEPGGKAPPCFQGQPWLNQP